MNTLIKICDMLSRLDMPTAYIMLFTPSWLLVFLLAAGMVKSGKKLICKILAVIPILNFVIFYLLNYTKGFHEVGIKRFGPHLIAAVIYCVAALLFSRAKKRTLPIILSCIAMICVSFWSLLYVLGIREVWHLGNYSKMGYEDSMAALIDDLEENYVLGRYKGIEYDELREEYIPKAAEAEKNGDEVAFAVAVQELCYEFHDGHLCCFMLDNELDTKVSERLYGTDHGFSMIRRDDGKIVAILADEGSDAYQKGIRNGVIITGWNGIDIEEALKDVKCVTDLWIEDFPIEENEDIARPMFLAGMGGDKITVEFIDEDGSAKNIEIEGNCSYLDRLTAATEPFTSLRAYDAIVNWPDPYNMVIHDDLGFAKMLDEHCGYICIPGEMYDDMGDLFATLSDEYPEIKDNMVSKIEKMKALGMDRLIIDIRGNCGGYYAICEEIVSLFTKEEIVKYCGFATEDGFEPSKGWIWTTEADGRYSDIPVVVLVNAGCASCGDLVAYDLGMCENVTLMGMTTTWGCAQEAAGQCRLTDCMIGVNYPIIATLEEDGTVAVDAGADRQSSVILDEKILIDEKTIDALYVEERDIELEYALEYINRQAGD